MDDGARPFIILWADDAPNEAVTWWDELAATHTNGAQRGYRCETQVLEQS